MDSFHEKLLKFLHSVNPRNFQLELLHSLSKFFLIGGIALQFYVQSNRYSSAIWQLTIFITFTFIAFWFILCFLRRQSILFKHYQRIFLIWTGFLLYFSCIREINVNDMSWNGRKIMNKKRQEHLSKLLSQEKNKSGERFPITYSLTDSDYELNDLINVIFIASLILEASCQITIRICAWKQQNFRSNSKTTVTILTEHFFIWFGGLFFCFTLSYENIFIAILLHIALWFNVYAVRKRSILGLLSLIAFIGFVCFYMRPHLANPTAYSTATSSHENTKSNEFGLLIGIPTMPLLVFLGHLTLVPMIHWLFSSTPPLDKRWWTCLRQSHFRRMFCVLLWFGIELVTCLVCAKSMPQHQEWFVVIPIFLFIAFIWLCFHLLTCITLSKLQHRVTNCNQQFDKLGEGNPGMLQIMASKGIRHFGLLSSRLIALTLISTILLGLVSWETRSNISLGLLLLLIPIECLLYSVFLEMGRSLGGTCIGYVLAAPTILTNPNFHSVTLLPPERVQESTLRCTQSLGLIQQFFSEHMIDNFGYDFSSSGMTVESVSNKLRAFFQKCTSDGPRYDTYLLYYCGQTFLNGDWALGEGQLKLEQLLQIWEQCCSSFPSPASRLLLVCDSPNSKSWLRTIRRIPLSCVALQTCIHAYSDDKNSSTNKSSTEEMERSYLNAFTRDWVTWNRRRKDSHNYDNNDVEVVVINDSKPQQQEPIKQSTAIIDWRDTKRPIQAAYAVSPQWCEFAFHLPSPHDLERHWADNFPQFTLSLLRTVNFGLRGNNAGSNSSMRSISDNEIGACLGYLCSCLCCEPLCRCMRHLQMRCLPPFEIDTGHGFRLVRSPHTG